MSFAPFPDGRFSADVRMQMRVNGHVFVIAQLGPDFVLLDDPIDTPPSVAEIMLSIDGQVMEWPVHLLHGITAGQAETRTAVVSITPPVSAG